jgi:hypothetical protein
MAATACLCEFCGGEFVANRSHARWCSDAHRKAAKRRPRTLWPADFERAEEALVVQVRRREAEPHEALLRIIVAWNAQQVQS